MRYTSAILWFRNDLRLQDHLALHEALKYAGQVIPLYCIDPRMFGQTSFGFEKTGPFRLQFLWESLSRLRQELREIGSDLIVLNGLPEEVIPSFARKNQVQSVFFHKEVTHEEVVVEELLEEKLFRFGITTDVYWGSTLFHKDDLPIPIPALPEVFSQYRKQAEQVTKVRQIIPAPTYIETPEFSNTGKIPLENQEKSDHGSVSSIFYGGTKAAKSRLHNYIWEEECIKEYKETRNGLLGLNYSTKLSPWLALGCISPREIYHEVLKYESIHGGNDSTYWVIFELMWRDYFRFVAFKHGKKLFYKGSIQDNTQKVGKQHWTLFEKWKEGQTGVPFVDANMRELKQTGFMSNRGRQNVASFLINDLGVDWRMGAEYFESKLIDFDVCSNWGNWTYLAGIGNDPRQSRYFNIPAQAHRYDPHGDYVRYWIEELRNIPNSNIHTPWQMDPVLLKAYDVELGVNYPNPLIDWGTKPEKVRR